MTRAFLFSGGGSHVVGMGATLRATCADCRATFAAADQALGYSLSRIMDEGPPEQLRRMAVAQPALLTFSVAQSRHLQERGIEPSMVAGHSQGQYAALVAAGALTLGDAVRLVAQRGRLMEETVPPGTGAMTAIIGMDRDDVYAACARAQAVGVVQVACHNAPHQTVISGMRDAVAAAAHICEDEGATVVALEEITAPSHCALLAPMGATFARLVDDTPFATPHIPVIDNVTAAPLTDVAAVRHALVAQLQAPVLMEESLRYMKDQGIGHYVQCGPGTSMLSFARRVDRAATTQTFDEAMQSASVVGE